MRFGILLDHQYAKGDDLRARTGELVELVQHIRDCGYDSVFGVHHYLSNLATPQPLPVLSRIIEHSGDMQLGTGILILPLGHPVHWAEEVATLDQMSGGRFVLGVGAGYREDEFASFGVDLAKRSSRMFESLEVMKKLWSGEEVHHEGAHFRLDGVRCSVLPYERPHPEIWVGANGPVGIKRAARAGYSWLAPSNVKRNWAVGNLEAFRAELAAHGEDEPGRTYPIQRDLCIADSREEAFALAGEYARRSYGSYVEYGMDYFESMWQDICEKALFFGTPDDIAAKIQDFASAGFDHFVFRVQWLGCPPEVSHRIIERFAKEVMPRFKEVS
ncbi:LLM class flavin-dependent oxidoreductase [Actinocorallia aurantiaca]|uniref:LLM class flavin-dependent oxidoreductase n=1 Tax=Actinocorallia aurantiaca TaxID=46204 RepID=A0ABN3UK57_9ACTN